MRLTDANIDIMRNNNQVVVNNDTLVDGDCCKKFTYVLVISAELVADNHKVFQIMFNRNISYDLRSVLCEWIEVCGVFNPIYNKVKFSIDVPENNKDSQKVVDYLNNVFYTSAAKVVGIRWAEFFKEDCLI